MSQSPKDSKELISACIDAEHELGEDDIRQISEDGEMQACWRRFRLVSAALKHNAGIGKVQPDAPTAAPEGEPAGGNHGLSLARAAMYLLVSGAVALAWLNLADTGPDQPGERQLAEAAEPRAGQAPSQEAQAAATATDFRFDYLIYHSAYVANSDSAVLPYVRLAGQD